MMHSLPARGVLVLVCLFGLAGTASAQNPQPAPRADAGIIGQVVDAGGRPVPAAVVTLSGGLTALSLTETIAQQLEGGPRRVRADGDGRFVFADLPAGSYTLEATKTGYLPGAYGRRRHGGAAQSLVLGESERVVSVRIPIWEFVAMSGTVVDEAGEPMVGIMVTARQQTFVATQSRLSAPVSTVVTDDRGVYRLDGLPPGTYVVCVPTTHVALPAAVADAYRTVDSPSLRGLLASADLRLVGPDGLAGRQVGDTIVPSGQRLPPVLPEAGGRPAAYVTTCYPGATPADAERVHLESGMERNDIHLALRPVPTAAVSGTLVDDRGPVSHIAVRLLPSYVATLAVDAGAETAIALTDAHGAFTFPAVPLGQYTLKVLRPAPPGPTAPSGAPMPTTAPLGWAEMPLTVSDDGVGGVSVPLRGGFRVSGRLELDGTSSTKPGPDLIERFMIQLDPADGSGGRLPLALRGMIDREGRISSNEMPPGRYVVFFLAFASERLAMPGWEVVGATIDGKDVSHRAFDLTGDVTTMVMTLSDRAAEITGTVRDSRGIGDPGAAILLFPADRDRWNDRGSSPRDLRLIRASQTGSYRLGSVPDGDYVVVAIPDEDASDWGNPDVLLAAMKIGTRVSMTKGAKKTLDLVTTPLRMGGR